MIELAKSIKSQNNNDISLYKTMPFNSNSQTILYIGVTHGDEPQGEYLINRLIQEVNNSNTTNNLLFIPCLNPDGRDLETRGNANGVDLNRNFDTQNWELSETKDIYYSGPSPASEIETKFLANIINEYKPEIILTIHAPYKVINYDGPAKEISQKIAQLNNYPVEDYIGYPTPGSFGTYCGIERNIATITLELPEPEDVSVQALWQEQKDALFYLAGLKD